MSKKVFLSALVSLSLISPAFAQLIESDTNKGVNEAQEADTTEAAQDPQAAPPPQGLIPENILSFGDRSYYSSYVVLTDKSARTVYIWKHDPNGATLVESYPSDHGRKEGDKQVLGDLKTPEGVYYFQQTYSKNQLDFNEYGVRAFTTDYPNIFDKRARKTGSGIWLHSIPPTKTLSRGSRGCVVVRIEAIEKIQDFISLGTTPIIIEDKVNYVAPESLKKQREQVSQWLETWRQSWETKNLEGYINAYSEDFRSKHMNKDQWRNYKKSLNDKYDFISVKLSQPSIYKEKDRYVIRFAQTYNSSVNSDFGEKTLYVKEEEGQLKIIAEEWAVASERLLAQKESITNNFNN